MDYYFHRLVASSLLVLGALACAGPSGESPGGASSEAVRAAGQDSTLTVMSFNIRYDNPDDAPHDWPNRRDRVARIVRFYSPDLLGLQEALHGQMEDLEERLPEYEWFGRGRQAEPEEGEYAAVFYRPERLELLESDTFWLSPTPDEPASVGWDAALPRIVTWGRLRDRRTGRVFYHFNTHFDHEGDTARLESAELLARRIGDRDDPLPALITGDFNFTPDDPPYPALAESLKDAVRASDLHVGPEGTSPPGFEVTAEPIPRIDYVWTTPDVRVLRTTTLSTHIQGAYPSDHLPVMAVVKFSEK